MEVSDPELAELLREERGLLIQQVDMNHGSKIAMPKRKYPSTPYLLESRSKAVGDLVTNDFDFWGKEVVITEKMDGENTTMYRHGTHARSVDSRYHPSRSYVRAFHASVRHKIAENQRIIMESVYAEHSIRYEDLDDYVYGIGVVEDEYFLDWDSTNAVFRNLGLKPVPVLYEGIATKSVIKDMAASIDPTRQEGFVVRSRGFFEESSFVRNVGKWVRQNHVQTDEHWTRNWVPNKLRQT